MLPVVSICPLLKAALPSINASALPTELCCLVLYTDLMVAGSLEDLIRDLGCGITEASALPFMSSVTEGLLFLHGKGIVHGAVKASNVLLGPDMCAKLTDYGCVGIPGPTVYDTNHVGVVPWTAPELLGNPESRPSHSSDVWSLGCLAVELLTGRPPFDAHLWQKPDISGYITQIAVNSSAVPKIPTDITVEGRDFVKQCLTRNFFRRPSIEKLSQHAWLADVN